MYKDVQRALNSEGFKAIVAGDSLHFSCHYDHNNSHHHHVNPHDNHHDNHHVNPHDNHHNNHHVNPHDNHHIGVRHTRGRCGRGADESG